MATSYDLIVIGSGPGGYVAAIRGAQLGMKTAVVERENIGGICLNWGCIPTKALLKSAEVMDYLHHVEDYGLKAKSISHDFTQVITRSRGVADKMSKGVNFLLRKNKVDVLEGTGKLSPGKTVVVTDKDGKSTSYTANHIIVATGARSRSLPSMPIDNEKIIGYRKAMTLEKLPKSMIVVGSGAIGMEFAYFYHTMGTEVTVVEFMDNILPREDKDVSTQMARIYKKKGMKIMTKSEVTSVDTSGKGVKATVKTAKGEEVLEAEILLSAVGVSPNTENIGLGNVGVKTDRGLIPVDDFYRTNVEGIYAIGDIVPGPALAHVASHEAIVCVEKIAGMDAHPIDYNNIPSCTYCSPEVASVGYTEAAAKEAGYELKVGKFPFSASGKATAAGKTDGFVKVIFDAKYGEFLGAHMIGAGVTDMIAEVVVARDLETTGHEIIQAVHPHPTMSEAVMEAAAEAYGECVHL
ncbi:dihydrolipoyl dehydrogenase [Pontibacter sp. G13]|uniref:dihydrolipoyl dehydrogenase n=1 Tax=Pontibacter sp. G13 TaxID=3074898 RepID=UPI0028898514|nr:dihydrolipoyl dehydrogenase [Pontibacter sp. G13]WNJ18994.1 dihydrolipoyl dehydrogenase [Pontibacter sp. G13]